MVFDKYPDVFKQESEEGQHVLFLCRCQQFIELVRIGDLAQCLKFMSCNLSKFHKQETLGVDHMFLKVNIRNGQSKNELKNFNAKACIGCSSFAGL